MSLLVSLAEIRDFVIILYGIIGVIFFFVAAIVTLVIGFAVKSLLKNVNNMMDESVKPVLSSIKDTADTIRGTSDFVGRTAVMPIAKTYGAFAGLKKGLGVLGGLNRRRPAK
jgi:hypothetical protein